MFVSFISRTSSFTVFSNSSSNSSDGPGWITPGNPSTEEKETFGGSVYYSSYEPLTVDPNSVFPETNGNNSYEIIRARYSSGGERKAIHKIDDEASVSEGSDYGIFLNLSDSVYNGIEVADCSYFTIEFDVSTIYLADDTLGGIYKEYNVMPCNLSLVYCDKDATVGYYDTSFAVKRNEDPKLIDFSSSYGDTTYNVSGKSYARVTYVFDSERLIGYLFIDGEYFGKVNIDSDVLISAIRIYAWPSSVGDGSAGIGFCSLQANIFEKGYTGAISDLCNDLALGKSVDLFDCSDISRTVN